MALTTPFAQNGDKKAIPQNTSDGSVSFDRGFGSFYALPPEEGGLFIDRAQFNQLMYDTTSQVLENKTAIATKANWNAVVNLTGNQTINGVKTFTSNITAPNITNLQNQMGGLISSNSYPLLAKNGALDITVGTGGTFSNIIDGLIFLKQNISKNPNIVGKITLLSSFNDDLYLKGYPFNIIINCNGFTLANNLFLEKCSITFNSLKLQGQLNALISTVHVENGATIGGNSSLSGFFGSSIVANGGSFVSISGNVVLSPPETEAGIYSKASRVYLVNPSSWTQNQGANFAYVIAGGIICADGGVNLSNVTVAKTNISANTLTYFGIIFGHIWG